VDKYAESTGVISAGANRAGVRVIHTDEELMIVRWVCCALGIGIASEKMEINHATKYGSRLDPFSSGVPP
jgi:hypothetical protein